MLLFFYFDVIDDEVYLLSFSQFACHFKQSYIMTLNQNLFYQSIRLRDYLFKIIQIMQIVNQIGHLQYWGMSPAANVLQYSTLSKQTPIRVLLSGCSDIRHILKTICDVNSSVKEGSKGVEFYFHETNKELLCRCLLFLHIIHETHLSFDERIEIYLDLFGNAMIKERNARYLHNLREDLLNLIHEEKNIITPLKHFVTLKLLRFQERDELSQIIQSWSMKIPFEMEKHRDQKLRFLYKERYDFRKNLIDWDYNMLLLEPAPIIHYYHYREWRLTGLAYEQRFSKYNQPNRTLSSYAPGKKKEDRTSCLVRGYWGDIIISPYVSLGVRCDYKQHDLLFKKANLKFIGHSVELSEYNMNYWLSMLEKGEQYEKVFRDYYRADEQTKKKLEQKNELKKKQKNLKQIKQQQQPLQQPETIEPQQKKKKQGRNQDLDSDEEQLKKKVQILNAKQISIEKQQHSILYGFRNHNVSVHLMAMNHDKLIVKKYDQFFDVVVLGFIHTAYLTKGIEKIVKKGGVLMTQKATYLIPKKKEERKELNDKLKLLIEKENNFVNLADDTDYYVHRKK